MATPASDLYHFDGDCLASIRDRMAGAYWIADVADRGRTVFTGLVLTSDRRCYSFLGETLEDAFLMSPRLPKREIISTQLSEARRDAFRLAGVGTSPASASSATSGASIVTV